MKRLIVAIAGIALAASGALDAKGPGHGNGGGGGGGGGGHGNPAQMRAAAPRGNPGHAPGPMATAGRGHGNAMRAAGRAHGNRAATRHVRGPTHARAVARNHGHGMARHVAHGNANAQAHALARRGNVKAANAPGNGRTPARAENKAGGNAGVRVLADGRHYYAARGARPALDFAAARRGLINGCPPGLAKKYNGCMPPGLARQRAWLPDWWALGGLGAGPYYYSDGYLVRLNGYTIAGYVPLLGGALAIGNPWPSYYTPWPVPDYYVSYYDLGPPGGYRYADYVLYRVDPTTAAITSIAALLTGDDFVIGEPIPLGYDIYNVPYPYRDQYVDGPDAWYRYSDGYIYQVDPGTRLVRAAIELSAR